MTHVTTVDARASLADAVHRNSSLSVEGVLERAFTLAFSGLVYAQIWEDPVVDMEALELRPDSDVAAIASGGCNLLSYLINDPARIHGVDLNPAHIALNKLKIAALATLPDHADFYRFFGKADDPANVRLFESRIAPALDARSRAYWNGRDWRGRQRVGLFARNIYRFGLLGRFIAMGHLCARLYGVDPRSLAVNRTRAEMTRAFDAKIAPLFEKRMVRWMLNSPMSLYGLGIPPAQFESLLQGGPSMAAVVKERLRKLLCDFDLDDNYFAGQALTRRYHFDAELPPYLQPQHYDVVRRNAGRVQIHHASMTEFLAAQPAGSLDRYVLLDAQDWMTTEQLNSLWVEITRTARPGSRAIFRTAAADPLLPSRLSEDLLAKWTYHEQQSLDLFRRDRSAIYGGFHLFTRDA
jgi:S-adenosylmethionine-diacylglycerol 3-amino-3-carboxypropyl transferase